MKKSIRLADTKKRRTHEITVKSTEWTEPFNSKTFSIIAEGFSTEEIATIIQEFIEESSK